MISNFITPLPELRSFFENLRAAQYTVEFERVGGAGDGGYLVPKDLDGIEFCFSPGVAECSDFEAYLADNFGVQCFLADASVERPAVQRDLFDFEKKFLGPQTAGDYVALNDWMDAKLGQSLSDNGILQMDIEHAEFDVLASSDREYLSKFRIILVEFHAMDNMFFTPKFRKVQAIFEKLLQDFVIVHLHPNNYRKAKWRKEIGIPNVMEVTFLRRDRLAKMKSTQGLALPHPLDQANSAEKPDYPMPEIWWKD